MMKETIHWSRQVWLQTSSELTTGNLGFFSAHDTNKDNMQYLYTMQHIKMVGLICDDKMSLNIRTNKHETC